MKREVLKLLMSGVHSC